MWHWGHFLWGVGVHCVEGVLAFIDGGAVVADVAVGAAVPCMAVVLVIGLDAVLLWWWWLFVCSLAAAVAGVGCLGI